MPATSSPRRSGKKAARQEPARPAAVRFDRERFDALMEEAGIVGEKAKAAALGIDRATLYRWSTDQSQKVGIRLALADALHYAERLDVNVNELFVPAEAVAA
jgi:hypothetical protein